MAEAQSKVPTSRKRDLIQIPDDSGASTDPHVVKERTAWIEKFFQTAFEMLDERMQTREVGRRGGDNDWETSFAFKTCALRRLTLAASHHSTGTRANGASAHETCGFSVGVSLGLKVNKRDTWTKQEVKTGTGPPRW
eukprot:COSAG02_NODE_7835_length_2829_cov_1.411355_2_plen_137_part_00